MKERKKERRFYIFWRQNLVSFFVKHAILLAFLLYQIGKLSQLI
jgi:hypothetical protein